MRSEPRVKEPMAQATKLAIVFWVLIFLITTSGIGLAWAAAFGLILKPYSGAILLTYFPFLLGAIFVGVEWAAREGHL